jgi:hypothetical protein
MTRYRALSRLVPALFATMSVGVVSLLGCSDGLAPASRSQPTVAAVVRLKGQAHGGQQPISGSTIQLYAVGINGSRSAATPLLTTTVVTDQNGSFNLTGDWDCTSNTATYGVNPLLYIVASGGNPGLSSGTNNTAILLMAAIGPCNTLTSSSFISMNELTTVAAVYALTPFMADVAHVGASGVNPAGLVNAFSSASMLVNWTTGAVPGNLLPASAGCRTELAGRHHCGVRELERRRQSLLRAVLRGDTDDGRDQADGHRRCAAQCGVEPGVAGGESLRCDSAYGSVRSSAWIAAE